MAKIMKKELVWDVFNTGDGSKIGVAKGDVWCAVLDEELSKKNVFYYFCLL